MDLLHQRLKWAPADLAEVSLVVRHELPAVARAIHADIGPSEIVIGLAETTIAHEGSFRSRPRNRAANPGLATKPVSLTGGVWRKART
jgi:hypothetical protein